MVVQRLVTVAGWQPLSCTETQAAQAQREALSHSHAGGAHWQAGSLAGTH